MTPSEIITKDAQREGVDAHQTLAKVLTFIKKNLGILLQENDSVLLSIRTGDGKAEAHIFTVETGSTLENSLKVFLQKLKDGGVKTLLGDDQNKNLLSAMKNAGWPIRKIKDKNYTWKADIA